MRPAKRRRVSDLVVMTRRGHSRRWVIAGVVAVVLLASAAIVGPRLVGRSDSTLQQSANPTKTVPVGRADLVSTRRLPGEVGYGEARDIALRSEGVITWLPKAGAELKPGMVLARVDDRPIVLLAGSLPFWRTLDIGAKGRDVRELEANLVDLGFLDKAAADTEFTDATAKAIRAWQKDIGGLITGKLDPAMVQTAADPLRIEATLAQVGDPSPAPALSVTGTGRSVIALADTTDAAAVKVGTKVQLGIGPGKRVPGVVTGVVAAPAEQGPGGPADAKLQVTIRADDASALAKVSVPQVDVYVVLAQRKDAVAVPVIALLALAEGGYGVEVVNGSTTKIVAVTVGMFAEGQVEVTSGVNAGDKVVVPS